MNSEKTTLEFEYNADGLRTQKVVTTTSDHVHLFQDTVHQPKCTKNGYTTHTCICGYIYQDSPVPATGHSYTASVVADTCTANGYTLYSCTCGDSYQEGAKGHTFTTLVVEPTETVNGFTLHQCSCGYSYESDPVASLAGANNAVDVISDTKVYDYVYNGSTLTQLTITTTITGDGTTTEELYFTYDGSSPMSVTYNGDTFYYVTNLQGDVIAILNDQGVAVVTYTYDAWGNILSIGGSKAADLGVANPLTYRGYVYDTESSLYYLQSRYYNPNVGRFINADALVSTGQGFLGNNMFAYCGNNPITRIDSSGLLWGNFPLDWPESIDELLHKANEAAVHAGIDTAQIGASLLDMYESSDGVYHASTDCWQQYFGYNRLYDYFFDVGTSIEKASFQFTHNGTSYIIWIWKADYINLGAGAEAGIYYGGGPHWLVDTSLAMPMTLSLDYKGTNIITHSQTTWWITGFNSNYPSVSAKDLTATFTFCFAGNPAMFYSFYNAHYGTPGWSFDSSQYTASFSF